MIPSLKHSNQSNVEKEKSSFSILTLEVENLLFLSVAFSWYPELGFQLVFEVVSSFGLFLTGQHKPLGKVGGKKRVLSRLLEGLLTARRYPKSDSLFPTSWGRGMACFKSCYLGQKFFFIRGWVRVEIKILCPKSYAIRNRIVF